MTIEQLAQFLLCAILFIVIIVLYEWWMSQRPLSPTNFKVEVIDMRDVRVRFTWTLSASDDVVKQSLVVVDRVSGEVLVGEDLLPDVTEFEVVLQEKQALRAELRAHDETQASDPAVLEFGIPDVTKPLPPTNFAWELVEVL